MSQENREHRSSSFPALIIGEMGDRAVRQGWVGGEVLTSTTQRVSRVAVQPWGRYEKPLDAKRCLPHKKNNLHTIRTVLQHGVVILAGCCLDEWDGGWKGKTRELAPTLLTQLLQAEEFKIGSKK